SVITRANNSWTSSNGCRAQITKCNNGGSNSVCSAAQNFCNNNILSPLAGNWDVRTTRSEARVPLPYIRFEVYYVPTANPDPYPPDFTTYINSVKSQIGAEVTWQESNDDVYSNFAATGDWMRNSRPDLETVINAGVRVLIYDGDA
ncbi:hypothetical protein H0H93_002189, partial [Arthromyces matolae]